ncbi:MAG: ABC transporter permease [Propionibacteriaceae bacterium]|nr:ABC transporter permease [Propionibacteriaceae bacterium]
MGPDPTHLTIRRRLLPPVIAHLLGSAKSMTGRLAALVAITAACLGIYTGGLSAVDSTLAARDLWFDEGYLADLQVHFGTVPTDVVPDFSDVDGVDSFRVRALLGGSVDVTGNAHLSLQLITGTHNRSAAINRLVLLEGEFLDPEDDQGILIDWHLSDSHQVQVGDELKVTLGDTTVDLKVRGVVRDAEFLLAPANPSLFIPTKDSLGVGFVNDITVENIDGFVPANSVLIRLQPGADISEVRQAILDFAVESGLERAYALAPSEQFSSLFLEKNLAAFGTVVPVIVGVTGLSSVFVTFFLLAQWLTRERRALGVLMTLGYPASALARAFMVIIAILAVLSIGLGVGVGYFLAWLFVGQYAVSVGLPVAATVLTPAYLWFGCGAIAVVFAGAAIFAATNVSRMTPLDAIRAVPSAHKYPGRVSGWLGGRLPTSWLRIAVRNTVRDKLVSVLTIVSMALGFGITASFFIAFYSVVTTAQSQVDASTWDLLADFRTPVDQDIVTQLGEDSSAVDVTGQVRGALQGSANSEHANLYVGGFDPDKLWYTIPMLLEGGDVTDEDSQGILIEVTTADQLGVGMGDVVELDSTSGHFEAHVIGIFSGALPGEARFTVSFAQEVFALDGLYTGMLVRVSPGELGNVGDWLAGQDSVQQVLTRIEIKDQITALSDQITAILRIGSSVSIVVAILFVLACLGYTVLKRSDDYQLLRCLGFRNRVVVATILSETLILGLTAMVVAVPIGAVTAYYTGWRISRVWFHVNTTPTVGDYVQTFVPALVLLPLVALPMARGVLSESLDGFMRSRTLG